LLLLSCEGETVLFTYLYSLFSKYVYICSFLNLKLGLKIVEEKTMSSFAVANEKMEELQSFM